MALVCPAVSAPMNSQFFFDDGGRADGVFHQVVIDLDAPVLQKPAQCGAVMNEVSQRFAHVALRQMAAAFEEVPAPALQAEQDRTALRGAHGVAQGGVGFGCAQAGFDGVEQLPKEISGSRLY
jgi:hypothetical protein